MKNSLPENTNTVAPLSTPPAIDKEDELDISALSRAQVVKIFARIIDRLNGIERASSDLYRHNYEEAKEDIVKIGDDSYSRANAIGNLHYKAVVAIADVELLQKFIIPATDVMNDTQSIEKSLPGKEKYSEELFCGIRMAFEPIKALFHSMWETEKHTDTAIMGEAIYERAITRLDEMEKVVKEEVGEIKFIKATRFNSQLVKGGALLSAKVV